MEVSARMTSKGQITVPKSVRDALGINEGDEIIEVDGQEVSQLAPDELAPLIRGDEGTTVEITVRRPQTNQLLTFPIVRAQISFPSAGWAMVPGTQVAVLRLIQFSEGASEQLGASSAGTDPSRS